jgi:hypothetical protein
MERPTSGLHALLHSPKMAIGPLHKSTIKMAQSTSLALQSPLPSLFMEIPDPTQTFRALHRIIFVFRSYKRAWLDKRFVCFRDFLNRKIIKILVYKYQVCPQLLERPVAWSPRNFYPRVSPSHRQATSEDPPLSSDKPRLLLNESAFRGITHSESQNKGAT